MHLQISRVRRNQKTYEYARLVQSYRRHDGMPAQRVIANLGQLGPVELENLRAAMQASRVGQRVVAERSLPKGARPSRPTQNLRFLDLAVLLQLWREQGLESLLAELLPREVKEVAPSDVVVALALQRCVDAGSKLYAERWFPRTALPELLRIAPASFNNTRVHRVLDALDGVTEALMRKLPLLYEKQDGPLTAMFLDVTDTRFVGHGPELAEKAKTKEGVVERKVGIVLLCNQRGYPLRWQVIPGRKADAPAMHSVLETIRGLGWMGEAPLVADRIMGASAEVSKLLAMNIRFLTAARVNEFAAYAPAIPHAKLEDLKLAMDASDEQLETCAKEAGRRMRETNLVEVSSTLFVQDLGIVERESPVDAGASRDEEKTVRALRLAREMTAMVANGTSDSFRSAGRKLGVTLPSIKRYRALLPLEEGLQQDILDGRIRGLSIGQLTQVARLCDERAQRLAVEKLVDSLPPASVLPSKQSPDRPSAEEEGEPVVGRLRVRAVLCFNPERFADERRTAQLQLAQVQASVRKLNERLARPGSRRTPAAVERAADRILRKKQILDLYRVHVDTLEAEGERTQLRLRLELDLARWQKRRKYDGFAVLLAHPDLLHSAADLAHLYRAKDQVEKDFQVIKGLVKLRPVWHRTNGKVRAHVTVCMLALLLERLLEHRLCETTSTEALETLATCHLNRFEGLRASQYLVTQPDQRQRELLRELRMNHLMDDDALTEQIQPR